MLASQPEVSDVLFTVGRPPQVEAYGELKPVMLDPPIEKLTPFQIETIAQNIIGDNLWQIEDLLRHGSCDASYALRTRPVSASIFSPSAAIIPSSAAS